MIWIIKTIKTGKFYLLIPLILYYSCAPAHRANKGKDPSPISS
ncbi:hypothetical protein [Klebsiella phage vB_KpnS-VAC51]|uniref:Uncharacterized protein n=1 Tax=Klebsiella phage vB_KpnS-VAC51 TaxID=2866698 RepID=A0AAE9C6R4_9CAUD|nr:hypothetical protein [Klebsiella phage vB_KpnS-VAC51]